jgi:two-component system nitrogen regulation response regulator GlnG
VDVRVIAATHRNLARAVTENRFREDLFHRLNVMRIEVPPLRERREDIPALLRHYLSRAADELGVAPKRLTPGAEAILARFDWPGNVRELVNACRRLTVLAPGAEIRPEDIPAEFGGTTDTQAEEAKWSDQLARWAEHHLATGDGAPLLDIALPEFERTLIRVTLGHVGGRRQEAARLLGWGRNTLTRKIKELKLD